MRVRPSVVLLLALAIVPAACGSGSSLVAPSLADAATKSSGTRSVKFDLSMAVNALQVSQPLTMTATGTADNTTHRTRMSIDMSHYASSVGGATANPADWRGTEIGDAGGGRFVIYMSMPVLTRLVPGHKPWIKMDLAAIGKRLGFDFSQLTNLSANPAQMLGWLRATSGSITKVGTETVDGVPTTHYQATVDLTKYPDLVPPADRAAIRRAIQRMTRLAHIKTFPVDAWVGNDGLVRKTHLSLRETVQGQPLEVSLEVRFHDFGAPVHVALPPPNQTIDLNKLAGGGA